MRPRRFSNPSTSFQVGDHFRPIRNFGRHNYTEGQIYRVVRVDQSDHTLVGVDGGGEEGNWIRWADCQPLSVIGWEWLKTNLPAEAIELLSAFDGLEYLRLREDVRTHILLKVPDLRAQVLACRAETVLAPLPVAAATTGSPKDEPYETEDVDELELA